MGNSRPCLGDLGMQRGDGVKPFTFCHILRQARDHRRRKRDAFGRNRQSRTLERMGGSATARLIGRLA